MSSPSSSLSHKNDLSRQPRHSSRPQGPRTHGLFRRIYFTYLVSTLVFAGVVALVTFWSFSHYGPGWVDEVVETLSDQNEQLLAELNQPAQLQERLQSLEQTLNARISLFTNKHIDQQNHWPGLHQERIGQARVERMLARLRRGQPVVLRRRWDEPPGVYFGLQDLEHGQLLAIMFVDAKKPAYTRGLLAIGGIGLLFVILAIATRQLARSFTRRLHVLETSALRIAQGDFHHRADVSSPGPRDEIDELATTFNEMAAQLAQLLRGQRMLLANVSHELRTPIARMRVLIELLSEQPDIPEDQVNLRIKTGIHELAGDVSELETLINDLLVSAKLEFTSREPGSLQKFTWQSLLTRIGAYDLAQVRCEPTDGFGDLVLLARLLVNLLSNAQRACPQGSIELVIEQHNDWVNIFVEDRGPGIPPGDREAIFEPFFRLDHARARDAGGVGLGLYLCRQIADFHGGTIHVEDRSDGQSGARFVVCLPNTLDRSNDGDPIDALKK